MNPDATRKLFEELGRNVWAMSALAVAANRGLIARLVEGPASVDELVEAGRLDRVTTGTLVDVLVALGLATREGDHIAADDGLRARVAEDGPQALADDLTATIASAYAPVRASGERDARVVGWAADDRTLVRAQGRLSAAFSARLAPMLRQTPALHERLSRPAASLLDIGAGAAGLCIAFARMYPELRVVGIEPSAVAIAEGRAAIAAAKFGGRIALRQQLGEHLDDEGLHAAAHVAQMFIPDDAIETVWHATLRALEFGGFLMTGAIAQPGEDFFAAIARWRNAAWGGGVRMADAIVRQLEHAGFVEVTVMPTAPGAAIVPISARKPSAS